MDKPVPAFYACYLLRSTIRHQNIYVGSTPHPVRRLKQHNGIAKGGAVRTSRHTLRPWEMTCLVTGFPSKIAALQFEWAWQNTHLTRHIAPDERITQANIKTRYSPKTGRVRKRVGRPRMSMADKLSNLHILLRAKSFERWPLRVRFYAEDVFKMWHRWTKDLPDKLRQGILIEMDQTILQAKSLTEDPLQPIGIQTIDPTYQHAKSMLEKSRGLLAKTNNHCAVCKSSLDGTKGMALVCPEEECNGVSHLGCLSSHFLDAEKATNAVVPTEGSCPTCKSHICWTDMIKDLSLRIRGEKEVTTLFKERKRRKKDAATTTAALDDDIDEDNALAEDLDAEMDYDKALLESDFEDIDELAPLPSDDDDWKIIDDVAKQASPEPVCVAGASRTPIRKEVIEDSDWDEAEIID